MEYAVDCLEDQSKSSSQLFGVSNRYHVTSNRPQTQTKSAIKCLFMYRLVDFEIPSNLRYLYSKSSSPSSEDSVFKQLVSHVLCPKILRDVYWTKPGDEIQIDIPAPQENENLPTRAKYDPHSFDQVCKAFPLLLEFAYTGVISKSITLSQLRSTSYLAKCMGL